MSEPIHSSSSNNGKPTWEFRELPAPSKTKRQGLIKFRHPGYCPPMDVLFILSIVDDLATGEKGVHYGTALTACKIIANNAVDGYLATDSEGRNRVHLDPDCLLTQSAYWFFTGDQDEEPYPVVPSFRDWQFPHDTPMVNWPETGVSTASHSRCAITRTAELIHASHLIPFADEEWFTNNEMGQYGDLVSNDSDQIFNTIPLRHDQRHAFDSNWFAIVPKSGRYVVHTFLACTVGKAEYAAAYHNVLPADLVNIAPEYLFARFARAVLLLAEPFILGGIQRHICRYTPYDNDGDGMIFEWLDADQLEERYGGEGGRKRKRKRKRRDAEDSCSDCDNDESWYKKTLREAEDARDRSWKRRCHDWGICKDEAIVDNPVKTGTPLGRLPGGPMSVKSVASVREPGVRQAWPSYFLQSFLSRAFSRRPSPSEAQE